MFSWKFLSLSVLSLRSLLTEESTRQPQIFKFPWGIEIWIVQREGEIKFPGTVQDESRGIPHVPHGRRTRKSFIARWCPWHFSKPFRNGTVWESHWRCWDHCKGGINSVEIPLVCLIPRTGQELSVWFAFWDLATLLSLFLAKFLYFGPISLPDFPLFSMGRG